MTDIFLSYSSKDRELVRPLVEVLESHGWSVWWDQEIPSGTNFGKVIETHLHTARCAIVAWTRNSVESDWVRNEASEAHSRGALIPIVLEKGVKFPLEFRQVQTLDLSDWQAGTKHAQFDRLFKDLQTRLSAPAADAANSGAADTQPMQPRATVIRRRLWQTATSSWWYALWLLALPALFVGVVAWALMHWKMPSTSVELDLTVTRIRVAFAADGPVPIIKDALAFRSLAVRNFARIELEPKCWSGIAADTVKCVEWRAGNGKQMVIAARARKAATVLIERSATDPTSANSIGQLQPFAAAANASVSFESDPRQPRVVSFKIENRAALVQNLLPDGLLHLSVSDAEVSGISGAYEARDDNFAFDVRTGNPSELVSITGGDRSFMLRIERASTEPLVLLGDNGAPIQAIDVGRTAEGDQGEEVSALVGTGELRYLNLPEDTKITLTPPTLLKLAELKNFWLTQLKYDPVKGAYAVQVRGEAKRIATFVGKARTDRRLSWFDRLWHDPKLRVLFAILTFVLGATPGLINLLSAARHR